MGSTSSIEWTDATWTVTEGCSRVSPGCERCYAETIAGRFSDPGQNYHGLAKRTKAGPRWTNEVRLREDRLVLPLRWRKPRRIFVCSTSDLFHEKVPFGFIDRVFAVMALAPRHVFQVLTKRPERMRDYLLTRQDGPLGWSRIDEIRDAAYRLMADGPRWDEVAGMDAREAVAAALMDRSPHMFRNVWLGTSVEDQRRADERIPHLLSCPAAVRFLSCEPLLGPVDLSRFLWVGPEGGVDFAYTPRKFLHWIIVGGESGPNARPMHPDWARKIRDDCAAAGVPFFFKQWGQWAPHDTARTYVFLNSAGKYGGSFEDGYEALGKVGKKRAGRLLDGREHNDMPLAAVDALPGRTEAA